MSGFQRPRGLMCWDSSNEVAAQVSQTSPQQDHRDDAGAWLTERGRQGVRDDRQMKRQAARSLACLQVLGKPRNRLACLPARSSGRSAARPGSGTRWAGSIAHGSFLWTGQRRVVRSAENLLGDEMMSLLPAALHHCLTEPKRLEDDSRACTLSGPYRARPPADCDGYRLVDNPPSPRWTGQGHALGAPESLLRTGVNLFGPVLIGPIARSGRTPASSARRSSRALYLGPSVEIRRCLLLAQAEVSHMSFLGHRSSAPCRSRGFFCSAVRNLRRGTVHVIRDGMLADTGEPGLAASSRRRRYRCPHDGHAGPPDHRDPGNTPEFPDHEELLTPGTMNPLRQIPRIVEPFAVSVSYR